MTDDVADTGLQKRRETQHERVTKAICNLSPTERGRPGDIAKAAIAAYPDPRVMKERDAPPGPYDHCRLHAMRHEFAEMCAFFEAFASEASPCWEGAFALVRALREQGVVR